MIVVVEGPSAAGKTTWIERHGDPATVVPEVTVEEAAAVPADPGAAAEFWVAVNSARNTSSRIWELPAESLPEPLPTRSPNTGADVFDALLANLPVV